MQHIYTNESVNMETYCFILQAEWKSKEKFAHYRWCDGAKLHYS